MKRVSVGVLIRRRTKGYEFEWEGIALVVHKKITSRGDVNPFLWTVTEPTSGKAIHLATFSTLRRHAVESAITFLNTLVEQYGMGYVKNKMRS